MSFRADYYFFDKKFDNFEMIFLNLKIKNQIIIKMKTFFFFLILFYIGIKTDAQLSNSFSSKLRQANYKLEDLDYKGALSIYEDLMKEDSVNEELLLNTAYCYLKTGQNDKAIEIYSKLNKKYKNENKLKNYNAQNAVYNLAWAYYYSYDFEKARDKFNSLIPYSNKKQKELLLDNIKKCDSAEYYVNNPKEMFVYKPSVINSNQPDYSPVISSFGNVIYFTSRRNSNIGDIQFDGYKPEDIYYSKIDNGNYSQPQPLNTINTDDHEATSSISPDGKKLFIYKWNGKFKGDLFVSEFYNNTWQKPVCLPKKINTKADEVDLCISPDNKTIIFSSNRKGGQGGLDLYIAHLSNDSEWVDIKNLKSLNTKGDETGPVFSPDGKYLYFCTNGRYGVGDFDIYKAKVLGEDKFSTPVNIGFPLNTVYDDVYFYPTNDPNIAYFFSKQNEGVSNIYVAQIFETNENNIFLKGYAFDSDVKEIKNFVERQDSVLIDNKAYPLNKLFYTARDTANIFVKNNEVLTDSIFKIPANTKIVAYNITENDNSVNTKPNDKGKYGVILKRDIYLVKYSSPNHIYDIFRVDTNKDVEVYNAELDTIIIGHVNSVKTTYFENKNKLSDYQKKEFKILADFLNQNPELLVDISAFSKNSQPEPDDENLQNIIAQYLQDNGVSSDRIYFNISEQNPLGNKVLYTIYDTLSIKKHIPATTPSPTPAQAEELLAVNDMNFEINQYRTTKFQDDLDALAKYLIDNPNAKIAVYGYTDTQGNLRYNEELSKKRANFVKNYLIQKGANPQQIVAEGMGPKNQISINKDLNGNYIWNSLKYNRRVEIIVLNQGENYKLTTNKIEVPEKYQINKTQNHYSIELLQSKKKIPLANFKMKITEVHWSKGYYSYLYGRFDSIEEAESILNTLKDKYPDAKIIKNNLKY